MNTANYIVTLTLFLISSTMLAQNAFRLEILGGRSFNNSTAGVFTDWGDSWTIGAGSAYRITKAIDIVADVIYQRYPYRGAVLPVAPYIAGLRWSVSGQSSNVVEVSVAARVSPANSFLRPFLSLGTGFYRIHIGDVGVSEWSDSNPQNVFHWTYQGTGVSATKEFILPGLGLSIPLRANIGLIVEGRFTETFDGEESFLPVQTTIQIGV